MYKILSLLIALNAGHCTVLFLLDLSTAIDSIDYDILIHCLQY